MKIVYFGTSEFAEEPLKRLIASQHQILAVVTQPDRPKGRGRKMMSPPVKVIAQESGLRILQPEDPNGDEFLSSIQELKPDTMVVAAYAHKLGSGLLSASLKGCINIHPSLLPSYRGAAPINWAIISGERTTGVTIIKMNERFDAGEVLKQSSAEIGEDETAGELSQRLSVLGSELLLETLDEVEQSKAEKMPQDESKVTKAPRIKKSDCEVDWSKGAVEIKNLVRGLYPKPGAHTHYKGKLIKMVKVKIPEKDAKGKPGEIVGVEDGIDVKTGEGVASLLSLQPEGKREMDWRDFKNGFRPQLGDTFGEES